MMDSCVFALMLCILVGLSLGDLSLSSTALSHSRQYYASTVDHAAQMVLKRLSQTKEVTNESRVSKVNMENTKVAESVLYSINLQIDVGDSKGLNYELQFVQPLSSWRSIGNTNALPAKAPVKPYANRLAIHGSSPFYTSPELSLTLNGPMELYFPHAGTYLVVKTPRSIDVGYVDRIILEEGTNITLTGSAELRMRDSLSIYPDISVEDNRLVINTRDVPKLNVYGHHIEVKNVDGQELKAQKKFSSVLEISPVNKSAVVATGVQRFEIPLNDSRIETVKQVLLQFSSGESNTFLPVVRKVNSGSSIEAVVSFIIPLEVEDAQTGHTTKWDVVVVQGSNHEEAKVISMNKQQVFNQVSFSADIAANGTLENVFQNFQAHLQMDNRLI